MSNADDEGRTNLDVYARPFVPQVLRDVNTNPANLVPSAPPRGIDYQAYVRSFAGLDLLPAQPSHSSQIPGAGDESHRRSQPMIAPTSKQANFGGGKPTRPGLLGPILYSEYFEAALQHESIALEQECEEHALFRAFINRSSTDRRPHIYSLVLPGLAEASLRLEIGDVVQLRQLRLNLRGEVLSGSVIRDRGGRPISLPHYPEDQYNSIVWGIDRRHETLSLRIDELKPGSMLFNVRFTVQTHRLRALHTAISQTQHALGSEAHSSWMRSMLFPEEEDGFYQKALNKRTSDLDFRDPLLNYEQSRAVDTVVMENYGPVPFIISGPPGTGKTKTIVELALQLIAAKKTSHLLICAPSDPAADTVIQRLSSHFGPRHLLRVNAPARSFPEVPNSVLPYSCVDDGIFSLPSFPELMRCKAVITTCRDAEILLRARVSNRDLFHLERNLRTAVHPEGDEVMPKLHWTALLMDEAAQATEPEALIPLSFVAPPSEPNVNEEEWPLFVMAGDQHQLGPRTASRQPKIQTSLFERLLKRPFYSDHPLARSKGYGGVVRPLTQEMLPILRPAFANLIRNYRSHPAILATPSTSFYHDTLEPEATDTNALLSWSGWKGRRWPVLFTANEALDEIETDGGGWYNLQEARIACQHAQSFVHSGLLQPKEICIMSPFQAQVRVIRKFARQTFRMPALNIGPLEAFQGLESRLVILCTTRTRDRFISQDVARGLGVIYEPKRFNVALTRAKQGLIVIGNPAVLKNDSNWGAFLGFCQRNQLYENVSQLLPSLKNAELGSISRLENQLIHQQESPNIQSLATNGVRKLGVSENAEDDLWTAGLAAEEVVKSRDDWIEEQSLER